LARSRDSIIFPLEGDALHPRAVRRLVEGDTVGMARAIREHCLRSSERALGIDNPFPLAMWSNIGHERPVIDEPGKIAGGL